MKWIKRLSFLVALATLSLFAARGWMPTQKKPPAKADLVIFSYDRPMQVYAFLESIEKYISGLGQVSLIYRTSNETFASAYQEVHARFPHVQFCNQQTPEEFKPLTLKATFASPHAYVLFAVDDIIVKDNCDLAECIGALQQTGAYGFYLRLGEHVTTCYTMHDQPQGLPTHSTRVTDSIFQWRFSDSSGDWDYPNTLDLTLYKKEEIRHRLLKIKFQSPNEMECHWAQKADKSKCGLYFTHSKMVNIPLNLVNISGNRNMQSFTPQELLEKFQAGLKIDISPLHQIQNPSAHIDYNITFIPR